MICGNVSLVAWSVLLYAVDLIYSRCEIANRDISIFFYYFINIRGVLYFISGILLRRLNLFGRIPRPLDCLLIVIGGICVCLDVTSVYSIPPIMYLVWRICKHIRIPTLLAKQSLCIYLMHMPVLIITGVVAKWYPSGATYGLKLFLGVSIPVFVGVVLSRYLPRVRSLLMGGR